MAGRTSSVYARFYMNGYNLSGNTRSLSPLTVEFDVNEEQTLADSIKGSLPGFAQISIGTVNATFDNTALTGMHVLNSVPGSLMNIMIPLGNRAAPAMGDPVFVCEQEQKSYMADLGSVMTNATLEFNASSRDVSTYPIPWGWLLRPLTATTGANAGAGLDVYPNAATTNGAYMAYQVTAGNGTATISVDDSADNATFLAVSGMTTGSIDCSSPKSGVIAISKTATLRRYCRWQLALGTATSVTFALAIVRGYLV